MNETKIPAEKESDDRKYYFQIPNLIDDLPLTTFEFRLYAHIKRVCGEEGVCWQSRETLAESCHMSTGEISKSKDGLIDWGLIKIEYIPNPKGGKDYQQEYIKDIWNINLFNFRKNDIKTNALKEIAIRLTYMAAKEKPEEFKFDAAWAKELLPDFDLAKLEEPSSPHELAKHELALSTSPHDVDIDEAQSSTTRPTSPHDVTTSPGDIKNNSLRITLKGKEKEKKMHPPHVSTEFSKNKNSIESSNEADTLNNLINHPTIQGLKEITGYYPHKQLWLEIIQRAPILKKDECRAVFEQWIAQGHNLENYDGWFFDRYLSGRYYMHPKDKERWPSQEAE